MSTNALLKIAFAIGAIKLQGDNGPMAPAAAHQAEANHYSIGTLFGTGTQQWRNLKHAIEEWNAKHAAANDFLLDLVQPTDMAANLDIRFCDILQRNLIAVYVPSTESIHGVMNGQSGFRTALSMCKRFRVPCLVDKMPVSILGNHFVLPVGPLPDLLNQALVQLLLRMLWSSFLILYKNPNDLVDLLPLFGLWRSSTGSRVSFRAMQLPFEADSKRYALFLKHVREQLRNTNIIIYTEDLGTVHSVLAQANRLNMTEIRHSFLVANMDLRLLEDFLGSEYHCNITGFQYVRSHPLIKLDLGLAMEAVTTIGSAVASLRQRQLEPRPQQLLCDAGDQWADGMLVQEQLRRVQLEPNERIGGQLLGITRMPNGTFADIGEWNAPNRRWTFDENYDEKNKWRFRLNEKGIPDLRGEMLRVVVYLEEPFVMRKRPKNGTYHQHHEGTFQQRGWPASNRHEVDGDRLYEGFCIDLLKEMAKLLNFTYEVVEVDDGAYGVEDENGRWNGIIGVLQRHEADLSVSAVTITYSRVSVIDFTLPFMHLGIAILMRRNMADEGERSAGSNLFTFMEPLSLSVWIALGVAYISVASTMWLLAKCSPYEWYDDVQKIDERRRRWRRDGSRRCETPHPSTDVQAQRAAEQQSRTFLDRFLRPRKKNQFSLLNSLWFAVGSLMQQGSDVIPRAAATRTVAVIWWLFTLILISSYTAQLAAFLTVERMSTPVESSADLAAQQRIKFGTLSNGSTMEFFRESKIPIYERMWSIMQSSSPTVFVNSSREGIARVRAGNYAYLMESTMQEYWIGEDCQLQTVGGLLDSKGYGVALPKGSPLRDIFSQAVLQLQERTILEALKNKWWRSHQHRPRTESAQMVAVGPMGGCPLPGAHSHSSLHRVFGIFYVLFAGILVALLLAIGEFCIESRRRQSLRLGLCLPGRLINLYFTWKDGRKERQQRICAGQRLKGSQLYLDNFGPVDGTPDWSEGRVKTETGTGRTRLSDSTFGSDSSYTNPSSSEDSASHSNKSLDEMADSIASLRALTPLALHHSKCPMGGQQPTPAFPASTVPRYRTMGTVQQQLKQQTSMPEQSTSQRVARKQMSLAKEENEPKMSIQVPTIASKARRKISEPAPPPPMMQSQQPRRKNSIRNVFSKMSTPSIVIGADPQDLLALQHLIPPTDERLLNRRQSSQEQIAQQAAEER